MRSRNWAASFVALALFAGCLLPSYENVSDTTDVQGGAPAAGSGAEPEGGVGPKLEGGTGAGGDGAGGARPALELAPERYLVEQGKTLSLSAAEGVLANDAGELRVTEVDDADDGRDPALDAELDIAEDGSLTFTPAADYFGRYTAVYTVSDGDGQVATSTVTFIVQPVATTIATVEQGGGGVLLRGSGKDGIGAALAALGDVNGDGFDDFAIGAPDAASGNGAVYIVFGRADLDGFELGALAGSSKEARYAVLSGTAASPIGRFVASAGKFDSDAVADIVVGAPSADSDAGRVFVAFGGPTLKTTLVLDDQAESERAIAFSGDASQRLGTHVAGPLDYDGDEKADLLAGLYPKGLTVGGVSALLENPVASVTLASANHATIEDAGAYNLPDALAVAGDVNDDGRDDWLASSKRHVVLLFGQGDDSISTRISNVKTDRKGVVRQRADNVTGVASVAGVADVNGDEKADFAICDRAAAGAAPTCSVFFRALDADDALDGAEWELTGFAATASLPLLSPGADLNQDGFADLLVADTAGAYVIFGRDSGFGDVKVTSLGDDGFSLAQDASRTISAISTIGDVNADGYGDFAIGDSSAASGAGGVYVVFGGPFAPSQR
jgi:hypothetical protein